MPIQHVLYIPFVLMVGLVIGYQMGARAVREGLEKKKREMKE
jgi:hypothetical protein